MKSSGIWDGIWYLKIYLSMREQSDYIKMFTKVKILIHNGRRENFLDIRQEGR